MLHSYRPLIVRVGGALAGGRASEAGSASTVTSTMRRAAHPSGCVRSGAGAGCSAINYQSLRFGGPLAGGHFSEAGSASRGSASHTVEYEPFIKSQPCVVQLWSRNPPPCGQVDATSPRDPPTRLIPKDKNNYHLVQISRIDGHRLVWGEFVKANLKFEISRFGLVVRVGGPLAGGRASEAGSAARGAAPPPPRRPQMPPGPPNKP